MVSWLLHGDLGSKGASQCMSSAVPGQAWKLGIVNEMGAGSTAVPCFTQGNSTVNLAYIVEFGMREHVREIKEFCCFKEIKKVLIASKPIILKIPESRDSNGQSLPAPPLPFLFLLQAHLHTWSHIIGIRGKTWSLSSSLWHCKWFLWFNRKPFTAQCYKDRMELYLYHKQYILICYVNII